MSKVILLLIALVGIAAACNRAAQPQKSRSLKVGNKTLNVEIADNMLSRAKGLGGRASLDDGTGMLFIFSSPDKYAFWMKDTLIPLDFIWISEGKVVEITPDVPTEPGVSMYNLKRYAPSENVTQVLEVNAGWSAKNGIKVGDNVILNP